MTKEVIATKVLPFLFPLSIENGLTVLQYTAVMALVKDLISQVENEHREKLQQLNSIHDEQKSALQVSMSENMQIKPGELVSSSGLEAANSTTDQMFAGLGLGSYVSKKDTGAIATGLMSDNKSKGTTLGTSAVPDMSSPLAGSSANLSLNQKQKMLADSENLKRMANQPQLTPIAGPRASMSPLTSSQKGSTDVKDLTSSLMSANLNQMKHSQSFSGKTFNSTTSSSQGWSTMGNNPSLGVNSSTGMNSIPGFGMGAMQSIPQHGMAGASNTLRQQTPDLSAFDNLLPTNNKSIKSPPMNSMTQNKITGGSSQSGFGNVNSLSYPSQSSMQRPGGFQSNGTVQIPPSLIQPTALPSQSSIMKPPVKSLTSNDINDLLS